MAGLTARRRLRTRCIRAILLVLLVFIVAQISLMVFKPSLMDIEQTVAQSSPRRIDKLQTHLSLTTPPPQCIYKTISEPEQSLDGLLSQMSDPEWSWIRTRILRTYNDVISGVSKEMIIKRRTLKRVLVVPGLLIATDFSTNHTIASGGPLGDLVQWADVISGLYVLGHHVTLMKDIYEAGRGLRYGRFPKGEAGCPVFDLIYVDIITVKAWPSTVLTAHACRLRVLDAYGTEAAFNLPGSAFIPQEDNAYGGLGLNLKQFNTFYPHTPDNTFLGFVVQPPHNQPNITMATKPTIGLLYGKDADYFEGKINYIRALQSYMDVHATLRNSSVLPGGVTNHGVLSAEQYQALLWRSNYLISVGRPLESTGVMEALARGCIIISPSFHDDERHVLRKTGKPTTRELSSQVPYLETLGPPHVITVDIRDLHAVRMALNSTEQVAPLIQPEFTPGGFLARLNTHVERQDFCSGTDTVSWPPYGSTEIRISRDNQSCNSLCASKDMICQPEHFPMVNRRSMFERLAVPCVYHTFGAMLVLPAYFLADGATCVLQRKREMFSCADSHQRAHRLCPCAHRHPVHTSMCRNCL